MPESMVPLTFLSISRYEMTAGEENDRETLYRWQGKGDPLE